MSQDKPESNIDPLDVSPEEFRAARAQETVGDVAEEMQTDGDPQQQRANQFKSSYQNYLFSSAGERCQPAWSDSTQGRAAIRVISRGLVGTLAFTLGGRISRLQLMNYNPAEVEVSLKTLKEKPLQLIAKGFDVTFGKLVKEGTALVANARGLDAAAKEEMVWNATNFRPKAYYHTQQNLTQGIHPMNGRSLGAEMVAVSFDFAMASIGDASTRNFFQMIDPNIRKTWMVNDQGAMAGAGEKSHFSPLKFAQSVGRSTWRVLSKNQGEDWAVALPYVYQMKLQRKLLGKAFGDEMKGGKIVFDNGWNGGALKINNEGKIIGDYQMAGAADLHLRFVGYNIYTLIFRESYDRVSHMFKQWKQNDYQMHMPTEIHPIDGAVKGARYLVKSAIKASLYMTPAVVPFWLIRAPQTKWRGGMINTEMEKINGNHFNAIALKKPRGRDDHLCKNPQGSMSLNEDTTSGRVMPGLPSEGEKMYVRGLEIEKPFISKETAEGAAKDLGKMKSPYVSEVYKDYKPGVTTAFSKIVNPFGKISYWLGGKAAGAAHKLDEKSWVSKFLSQNEAHVLDPANNTEVYTKAARESFVRNLVDNSLAYTPYMFAKAEFGLRVDDSGGNGKPGNMDKAIYRLIDNTATLKLGEAGKAVRDIWDLSVHIKRPLISREGGVVKPEDAGAAVAVAEKKIPTTTVQAEGRVRHDPIYLSRDDRSHAEQDAPDSNSGRWADAMTDRKRMAAAFAQNPSPTLH